VQVYDVKRLGWKDHTLEPRADLMRDVPHLVKRFEAQHKVRWSGTSKAAGQRSVQPTFTP